MSEETTEKKYVYSPSVMARIMRAHDEAWKEIEHNLTNVRKWFSLPRSVIEKASQFIQPYKASGKKICIVHFRVGNDYLLLGYKLSKSYWKRAAAEVLKAYPEVSPEKGQMR